MDLIESFRGAAAFTERNASFSHFLFYERP